MASVLGGAAVPQRPNCLEVDLDAIAANVALLRELVGSETMLIAAVKANGYGFGLPEVAETMRRSGADAFSLAEPCDAVRLRDAGIDAPILLYAGVLPEAGTARLLSDYRLMCTLGDIEMARAWSRCSSHELHAFLKVDVGLERIGVGAEQAAAAARTIVALPRIRLVGVYTHLHAGSVPGYLSWQLDRFDAVLDELAASGIDVPIRLAESSVTLGLERRPRLNAVDPGHLLYGFLPAGRSESPSGLRPALLALKTKIVQVKVVSRPAFHDAAPMPLRDRMRIGVVPLGRADGLRSVHCGEVLVRGRRVPIVGPISLEHARIDLSDVLEAAVGDEVVVIGCQGDEEISAAAAARAHSVDELTLALEIRSSVRRAYRAAHGCRSFAGPSAEREVRA